MMQTGEGINMEERVLLVDDDEDFLEVMAERLRFRGIKIATAVSAQHALELITEHTFEVVILDFSMPEIDGFKALKMIKEKQPAMKVILMTGYGTVEKSSEAMHMGATDFIEKPPDIDTLVQKIKS